MAGNNKYMQENQLKNILEELYILDPSLKNYESELVELIKKMKDIKPETKFDAVFASRLKEKIMSQSEKKIAPKNSNKKIFNFINKKVFVFTGSVAVVGIVVLAFSVYYQKGYLPTRESFVALPDNAFGSLASLNTGTETQSATGARELASAKTASDLAAPMISSPVSANISTGGRGIVAGRMISAPNNFKYVYKGDDLNLSEETAPVYRRLKGDQTVAKELAASISNFDSLGLGLKNLDNLKVTNLSLAEDKKLGLMVNFDFNEDNIYISENYAKWTYPEREACGSDQNCLSKYQMKLENIPADSALIKITDKFLTDHKINRAHYGEPQVDNSWRDEYEKSEDKTNYYIPEDATVIYPLLIDGQKVKNQSGTYVGLQVTVNLLKNAVSGLSGLTPYRYETSNYPLETSAEKIIKKAEAGGWNRNYFIQSENVKTIELGTPERTYVQVYKYENNGSEELLVPALVFPVINLPQDSLYCGNKSIIVPLVSELLDEADNQPVIMR